MAGSCGICGVVILNAAGLVAHMQHHIDMVTGEGGCTVIWAGDAAAPVNAPLTTWHRCELPTPHDEPHLCRCGQSNTPAPMG